MISMYLERNQPFELRPSQIQHLQSVALAGLPNDTRGAWRTTHVEISKSKHTPPGAHLVPTHVLEMCDYVNDNLHECSPFHLAAYVMWRINWIHPFEDGNGRTSRIISYIVLSTRLGTALPGTPTIPQQIQADRSSYFGALEAADAAYRPGDADSLDVSQMEGLLKAMLSKQLLSVVMQADGA